MLDVINLQLKLLKLELEKFQEFKKINNNFINS